ncbi:CubicO group peptidase (beta-lactamase class C family) [Flavobacterium sp. 90]|uniref:serine hydrolase n=1 Tax=unclassified Flavobacterium TaxID=196869 RepID=UPI000EB04A4C|nr:MULTISPECIES: serine hydrolase [unclassified Flavobacterium]RKR05232.1 CubicO group peptidase (beta-lactamase class C family) [Flavobacterium sp. 81]TCK56547.1 CubicO group peptidase (beta-lactamase class C family) [Flavobacterium sp. 90]
MRRTIMIILLALSCALSFAQKKQDSINIKVFEDLKKSTSEMMLKYNLKGLSVAVFENYKIIWTNQWGIKASDSKEKIDENTAFSTASISKPITAIVCAMLEEKGLINLDDPIENYLERWKLPESTFSKDTKVTWKQLLSHTAGTSQGGFEDYYTGDSIPTIVESLQGKLLPRSKKPIEFLFKPGTNWEYSGGGYVIIQCALEDHFKKPLAQIVKETLLDPLQLQNSTMLQPNEKGFLTNIAKVHNSKGEIIRTGIPITPQVAPSGLWSTPTDLAFIAIEMQKALSGKGNKIISTNVARKVTDIVTMNGPRAWSYGWQRSLGYGNLEWFSHDGSNTGTGGDLLATMTNGNGIAILANGDKPNRLPVMCYMDNEIITKLHWIKPINTSDNKQIPKELKEAIKGYYNEVLYGYNRLGVTKIFEENNHLYLNSPYLKDNFNAEKNEMYYIGNNSFKVENYPNIIRFNLNKDELKGLTISRPNDTSKELVLTLDQIRTPQTQLIEIFSENTFEIAEKKFKQLRLKYPDYNFEESLNNLGYSYFNKKQTDLSLQIFKLNCLEYPKSANAYDSLGEIYEAIGKLELAKQNYQKSLDLNPKNENAAQMISKIDAQQKSK